MRGIENKFDSLASCQAVCQVIPQTLKTEDITDTDERCFVRPRPGCERTAMGEMKWTFEKGACLQFNYVHCGCVLEKIENKFDSLASCQTICQGIP